MTVRWGIISAGRHPDLKVVPAMKLAEDTEVVAAYSRDIQRARDFAERHQIPDAHDSLDELLGNPDIDAVFISSPNSLHAEHTAKAAEAGKNVLVEKPMAVSVNEAQSMVSICRERGVRLGVGFHLRHHPGHIKARDYIQRDVLGLISMAQAQWCAGTRGVTSPQQRTGLREWWGDPKMVGGASMLTGTGVHALDLLQFLLGQRIVEVSAITDGQTSEHPLEQKAVVALRFDNGIVGTMSCGRYMPDTRNDATVYGSNGRIHLSDTVWEPLGGQLEVTSESVNMSESYEKDLLTLYRLQVESFNRSLVTGEEFHASGLDGLSIVQVTSAIIESAATGRAVRIEQLNP